MKIVWLAAIALSLTLNATTLKQLINAYQEKNYYDVCMKGTKIFDQIKRDENLVTMYAFSCLHIDKIDRLAVPILVLGKTPASRKNRAYFSLILAQKNILVSALLDGTPFHNLSVPNTDYVLSRVFTLFFQKKYKKTDNRYIMQDDLARYELYTKRVGKSKWVFIEETRKGKTYIHRYR